MMCSSRDIFRDYEGDYLAKEYDAIRPGYPDGIRDVVLDCLKRNSGSSERKGFLLDVACGGGKSTRLFSSEFENILGIDVSHSQIKIAKETSMNMKNIKYALVDDHRFPVPSNSVDVVFCATALHYLDPPTFFAECDRVLKDGGIVAITYYPTPQFLKALDGSILGDIFSKISMYREAFKNFFRACGMKDIARKHFLNGYKSIYSSIKNPTKRWESQFHLDRKYTLRGFLQFMKTCAGYYETDNEEHANNSLNRFRETLREIFDGNSLECEDDTEFMVTYGFRVLIIEKKDGLKIE